MNLDTLWQGCRDRIAVVIATADEPEADTRTVVHEMSKAYTFRTSNPGARYEFLFGGKHRSTEIVPTETHSPGTRYKPV